MKGLTLGTRHRQSLALCPECWESSCPFVEGLRKLRIEQKSVRAERNRMNPQNFGGES